MEYSVLATLSLLSPSFHFRILSAVSKDSCELLKSGDTVAIRAANGANDKANARGVDVAKLHVGGSVIDSDGIVLAPDVAEVNVHIAAGHIKAVGVEGRHVFQGVLFLACESPSINIKYVDLKMI
mmetsp:Transcript_34478/g.50471  ORF Transcript_34478/g.50471 Transcript_34478/m.50471 type:complete len:125 (-) Transcript_34478:73-447(-)